MLVRIVAFGHANAFAHVRPATDHTEVRAIFLSREECDNFSLETSQIGDLLDLERIEDTNRGPRGFGARFLERPEPDHATGIVRTIHAERGFAFMTPDDGEPDIFLHARSFSDFDGSVSDLLWTLSPGDRVRCLRLPGGRGPRGIKIEAA